MVFYLYKYPYRDVIRNYLIPVVIITVIPYHNSVDYRRGMMRVVPSKFTLRLLHNTEAACLINIIIVAMFYGIVILYHYIIKHVEMKLR